MQYPFELLSVTSANISLKFRPTKIHTKEHLAKALRKLAPTDDNFYLVIRTSRSADTDEVHVNIKELATPKYPFKLHSIAPVIRGEASEMYTVIYHNHLIKSEEQLRGYFKDTSAKQFEIAYFDTSELKFVRFRLSNARPVDVSSLPMSGGLYPFRLVGIAPIIDGSVEYSESVQYPHNIIRGAEHLSTYLEETEHNTFEITYCDLNEYRQRTFIISKSDLVVDRKEVDTRSYNVGASDYAKHKIQPWDIWLEYDLGPWDADIIKRVLRTKKTDGRRLDYEKIIHICKERIRQIDNEKI